MDEKIKKAIEYVRTHGTQEETKNDAANIFAENYGEYLKIWDAIESL